MRINDFGSKPGGIQPPKDNGNGVKADKNDIENFDKLFEKCISETGTEKTSNDKEIKTHESYPSHEMFIEQSNRVESLITNRNPYDMVGDPNFIECLDKIDRYQVQLTSLIDNCESADLEPETFIQQINQFLEINETAEAEILAELESMEGEGEVEEELEKIKRKKKVKKKLRSRLEQLRKLIELIKRKKEEEKRKDKKKNSDDFRKMFEEALKELENNEADLVKQIDTIER